MQSDSMILLGSTGSIGTNALLVAQKAHISVEALCAGRNIDLLNTQINTHKPRYVCIANKEDRHKLIKGDYKLFCGNDGILALIESSQSTLVVNALVGFIGLGPSLKAIECGKKLALANKESLVSGGWLFKNTNIIPIDSEHFGLWYLLKKPFLESNLHRSNGFLPQKYIKKLYITASGGALRDMPLECVVKANLKDTLKHPNWQMGAKITIDSASMANKLFEILEAYWLFGTKNIDALIEANSAIHSLVAFSDGSITAHIAKPDMKLPIAYALLGAKAQSKACIMPFDLHRFTCAFQSIDTARYPLWKLKSTLLNTPQKGIILNASNEVAVNAFIEKKICFGSIANIVLDVMDKSQNWNLGSISSLADIIEIDAFTRKTTQALLKSSF